MIIDAHAHIISGDIVRYPSSSPSGQIAPADFDNPLDIDHLLGQMDRNGVTKAVVVQRGSIYGFDNSYVCDSASLYPDRLRAVCSIDATSGDGAQQVKHWVGERAAAGIRLMELVRNNGIGWLDSPLARSVWNVASEMDVPVCVHFFPWNRAEGLARLAKILTDIPGLTVVVDHLGAIRSEAGPPDHGVDELLEAVAQFAGVNVKFTTIPLGRLDAADIETGPVLRRIMTSFGAERILWGSDIAQSQGSYEYMLGLAHAVVAGLPSAQQDLLLGGTAARIYRMD